MIRRDIDINDWKKQNGFSRINSVPCKLCGKEMPFIIPIETKEYVGMETGLHECGDVDGAKCMVRKSKQDYHIKHVSNEITETLQNAGISVKILKENK